MKAIGAIVVAVFLPPCLAEDAPKKKPDEKPIEVTAAAIHKEFKTDEKAAAMKYEGKMLQISGLSGGQTGTDAFYLKEKKDSDVIVTDFYYKVSNAEKAKLKAVKPNTKVVIVGEFRGFLLDKVELDNTRLVRIEK